MFNNNTDFSYMARLFQSVHHGNIQDLSDEKCTRLQMRFRNGVRLSIIQGYGTYGVDDNLYEIAAFDSNNEYIKIDGDDLDIVKGWQTTGNIIDVAHRLERLP